MTTKTAIPEPPERDREEPFTLSDTEVTALADTIGIRRDLVRLLKGNSYSEVRESAQKVHDGAPSSRVSTAQNQPYQPSRGDATDPPPAKAIADAIRRRMGLEGGK